LVEVAKRRVERRVKAAVEVNCILAWFGMKTVADVRG
jgi:hypothetical protein